MIKQTVIHEMLQNFVPYSKTIQAKLAPCHMSQQVTNAFYTEEVNLFV